MNREGWFWLAVAVAIFLAHLKWGAPPDIGGLETP